MILQNKVALVTSGNLYLDIVSIQYSDVSGD